MTITEFAELQFHSADFLSQPSLRDLLLRLRTNQGAWSGFPVHFYTKDSEQVLLHLISGWQSVPAHEAWIASDENQTLLKLFEPHVQITDFVHLDVEFGGILGGGEERLRFWKNKGGTIDEKRWEVIGNDVEEKKTKGEKYCFSHVDSDQSSEGEIIQRVSL
ncbi:hypothetical protein EV421DRAFT_1127422 [Armillaria borealis]|uniref:ABM domain-containing protein n=1 Tax=Armillaria borealis TaxID=47425 RepID=A0AA39MJB2_9AGAR|nr:hypothetical protein EV421DRAFT_1127422 [Armillaria borealis]